MKRLIKRKKALMGTLAQCGNVVRGSINSVCGKCNRANCICEKKSPTKAYRLTDKDSRQKTRQEWQAHNSYNQNGRYYTLPDVPEYDANGLWRWCGVFFSRAGTLKQTVIELVGRSAAGMDAGELRELPGLDPRSFLSAFANHPQLRREKTRGRFVYVRGRR